MKHILEQIKNEFPDEKNRKKILDHEMDVGKIMCSEMYGMEGGGVGD